MMTETFAWSIASYDMVDNELPVEIETIHIYASLITEVLLWVLKRNIVYGTHVHS